MFLIVGFRASPIRSGRSVNRRSSECSRSSRGASKYVTARMSTSLIAVLPLLASVGYLILPKLLSC